MATLPLAWTLTTPSFSIFKQRNKIISNPKSLLPDYRTNKSTHLNGFRVSAKAADRSVGVATVQRKQSVDEALDDIKVDVEKARKDRDDQWKKALDTILAQIKQIRRKIQTHFLAEEHQGVADPMLVILEDVEHLVAIHKLNVGLRNPIPTTEAMMKVANHFQAYKQSETDTGVIPVDPRPKRTAFSPLIDMFTEVANLLYGQRGQQVYLADNFGPVREETPPTEIQVVEGQLPSCIKGMLIRNGPNPQFEPLAKYRWLDGDGMLHATYFKDDGKVTYASRYTKTSRFKQEQITGQAEFPKYGDYTGAFGVFTAFAHLLKAIFVLDTSYGSGVANENVAYHAGLLLALEDFDRPYAIKIKEDGDLETLGVYDFQKKLSHNCTPHTKKDPKTGELFIFGAAYTDPYMTYRVVSPDGTISEHKDDIEVSGPTYMHDFAITDNYVIIMDLPFTFSPEAMLKYNDWVYNFNHLKTARFGIRTRDPTIKAEVQWFEFEEPFFIFHTANAWEDGDKVVLYGCRMDASMENHDSIPIIKSVLLCTALVGENFDLNFPELYKFTFDMKTGEATQEQVAEYKVDYPKINENYMASKSRYVYTCEFNPDAKIPSIAKFDLEAEPENRVKRAYFGEKTFGSEVAYVPSVNANDEDDGFLVTYVHNEITGKSYVYVICAKNMEKVAALELPHRVPYGFHATFINEDDLKNQRNI